MRWTTNRRWSPCSTGTTSRAPMPSCSSSAGGMSSPAAAATLIASNGAVSGSPRAPSPTTTVTLWMPAARRLRLGLLGERWRGARRVHTCAPSLRQQRRVVARAGADVEDALVAVQLEQLAHAGDDERLRDRLAGADRQRDVVPRLGGERLGDEQVARDVADRLQHALVADVVAAACRQAGRRPHAITPPAARTSASARSESPGSTSTPRTALESTVTAKPARSASRAVFLTQ